MIIYFKETRDIFGINWKEQGISVTKEGNIDGIYQQETKEQK